MDGPDSVVCRDGCPHSDSSSDTEGSAEQAQWRRDTAGDGQVPFCVISQGLSVIIMHTHGMTGP